MLKNFVRTAFQKLDYWLCKKILADLNERNQIISILFHHLLPDTIRPDEVGIDPQQGTTIKDFSDCVSFFKERGYVFLKASEINADLPKEKKYVLLTFDDGYASNLNVIDILDNLRVPAVFYISINHIMTQKCFWWDVFYREMRKEGKQVAEIKNEVLILKEKNTLSIETYLKKRFGTNCLMPISEYDRPFTKEELVYFSRHPRVEIGNHTFNHEILTNLSRDKILKEMSDCQMIIHDSIGYKPQSVSFPNGNYNPTIIQCAEQLKFLNAITVDCHKSKIGSEFQPLTLGRYILWGGRSIAEQCLWMCEDGDLTMKRW